MVSLDEKLVKLSNVIEKHPFLKSPYYNLFLPDDICKTPPAYRSLDRGTCSRFPMAKRRPPYVSMNIFLYAFDATVFTMLVDALYLRFKSSTLV